MKNFKLTLTRQLLTLALLAMALAGQAQTKEVKMISSTDLLTLRAGWNLISLDVIPTPATPEAVFAPLITASNLQMVTGFQNQQGVFFDPTELPFLNTLAQIITGEGYWVKLNADFNGFTFPVQWPCGDLLKDDHVGKTNKTVTNCILCWMKQNLNDGTRIVGTSVQANNGIIEKYCSGNPESNCDVYGGLYQWNEMMQYLTTPGIQGICPPNDGWHLPSDAERTILITYPGGERIVGGKMKETGYNHWGNPNTGATNSSGFTGLPGGFIANNGSFYDLTNAAYLWSSSQSNVINTWFQILYFNYNFVSRTNYNKLDSFTVRCIIVNFILKWFNLQ
jgi:uncharacterized protein (TIGR02145 family)